MNDDAKSDRLGTRLSWRAVLEVAATVMMMLAAGLVISKQFRVNARPSPRISVPNAPLSLHGSAVKGTRSARAVAVEFSDFQCPFCGKWAREVLPLVEANYVQPGRLRIAFRHLPLPMHQFAASAAEGAACADRQGRFWQMHDLLFARQRDLDRTSLERFGHELGLDEAAFERCLAGEATALVRSDSAEAKALGISGTPTFFLGLAGDDDKVSVKKALSGAVSFRDFAAAIDTLLSQAGGGNQ